MSPSKTSAKSKDSLLMWKEFEVGFDLMPRVVTYGYLDKLFG